ncbi:MAG: acyl-CoA dehydratase activase [Desulfobacterales bacterium]|jgi:predicted CoA-substrate-specific enzyme activase|nr:acyl-CoA dehydratase activase [Desulfobacterales bacterium]
MTGIFGGIDIGNRSINAVLIDDHNIILSSYSKFTQENAIIGAKHALNKAIELSGKSFEDLKVIVATGVGKKWINFANKKSSEVVCQALGASLLYPQEMTIVNIGAESYRAINVNERAVVTNYVENDKCAAGSGIFLEEMSSALGVDIEKAGEICFNSPRIEKISSFCAVFAESEVVSAIHRGIPIEELLAGVHEAIVERIASIVRRVKPNKEIVLTGGLANNICLKKMLQEKLDITIIVPENPTVVGALGAAIQAKR